MTHSEDLGQAGAATSDAAVGTARSARAGRTPAVELELAFFEAAYAR
jgi:hypothetical protein